MSDITDYLLVHYMLYLLPVIWSYGHDLHVVFSCATAGEELEDGSCVAAGGTGELTGF